MKTVFTIATRESALALWQAEHVAARLRALHPSLQINLLPMTTRGDQILDRPLSQIGGKGLFLKELEVAMQEGRADFAVHSLKDVPMELPEPFQLAAVLQRESPFDAWVSNRFASVNALPQGARVGSSSLRRQVQLRVLRPDLQLLDLRGNVQTRLGKLDSGQFDGIILAESGLRRLQLDTRIASVITPEQMLPAAGQGALAIECLRGDAQTLALLAPLVDQNTWHCVSAERAFAQRLGGSCQVPIGAFAQRRGDQLRLRGLIGDRSAHSFLHAEQTAPVEQAHELGIELAETLIAQGAESFLRRD